MTLALVITAAPYSGTGYVSQVLTHAGLPCGHEDTYALGGVKYGDRRVAESSWVAARYLGTPQIAAGATVVHQTRDPIAWLNSITYAMPDLVGVADPRPSVLSEFPGGAAGYNRMRTQERPIDLAMTVWVAWNRKIDTHALYRYRVEDLSVDLVQGLGALAGVMLHELPTGHALVKISKRYNAHRGQPGHTAPNLTWGDLPKGAARDAFAELAVEYGYGPGVTA